jgi:hypothetical protein
MKNFQWKIYRHIKYIIQKKKREVSQHKPPGPDLCKIHLTQQLRITKFHEQICLLHHIYGFSYNI